MRHKLTGRQLSRNSPHRHALMRNMAGSLLRHETIRTTLPKAKELRRVVEPLITLGKSDSDSNRRLAFSRLRDSAVVSKLFVDLGPRFRARPGGYTRILRMMPGPGGPRVRGGTRTLKEGDGDEFYIGIQRICHEGPGARLGSGRDHRRGIWQDCGVFGRKCAHAPHWSADRRRQRLGLGGEDWCR